MKLIFYLLILLLAVCCNTKSPKQLWDEAIVMRTDNNMKECMVTLETIIKEFPNHDLATKAQYQKAEIYLNDIKDFDFAIEEFKKVIEKFPNHELSKNSLFMIAYIDNNYLNAYTDAINNYNLFKEKYPNDALIPSVEYELEGLLRIEGTIDSLNLIISRKINI